MRVLVAGFGGKKSCLQCQKTHTQESIHRYLNAAQTALNIPVFKAIVETIVGEMLFKPELDEDDEEMEPITMTNALKLFE